MKRPSPPVQRTLVGALDVGSSKVCALIAEPGEDGALNILGTYWAPLADVQPWIDLWAAQAPLFTGELLSGEQWAQIGTSNLIWVVLPFALGLMRVLRSEVK